MAAYVTPPGLLRPGALDGWATTLNAGALACHVSGAPPPNGSEPLLYVTHYLFQSPTHPILQALLAPVTLLSHLYGHVCKARPALAHLA